MKAGDAVILEHRGAGLWAHLNRPDTLNAINYDVLSGLQAAMTRAEDSDDVAALVITGSGGNFCAGADLSVVEQALGDAGGLGGFLASVGRVLLRLEQLPLPTIAAVGGHAVAGGLELMLCCDLVVAADDAVIGDAHSTFGLLPGGGGTMRLPRHVGLARAKELMFTGATVSAGELRESGLLAKVVPRSDLLTAVESLVHALSQRSPLALRRLKRLLNDSLQQSPEAALRSELMASELHSHSSDMREGVSAFREKRRPKFTGQ